MPCHATRKHRRVPALTEPLDPRVLLSVSIQFDYQYDTSGFFTDARKQVLQAAANALTSRLTDSLAAIPAPPSASDSWTAQFTNPATGSPGSISNLTVPADTILIFVGGGTPPAGKLGYANTSFSYSIG
ncbi:MAG: hypothetical protein ACREJC_19160, partial [Tepidisphaeraceae bacterium]